MRTTRQRFFQGAIVLAGLAAFWTVVVMWTGGVLFYVGSVRIASRGARNALILASLSLLAAWALGPSRQRYQALVAECLRLAEIVKSAFRRLPSVPRPAQTLAAVAAVAVVVVGLTEGAFVVGASDPYGYVSQAHLWAIGQLRQQPALFRPLAPDVSLEELSPLGYRPSVDRTTIAPTYPPGLPMTMAVFERLGGPGTVFWVVPILGGVLVWTTYLLGARIHGPSAGALAAVLVATSPPFLMELTMMPMSDLPAAAWWALAILLASIDRRVGALGAGAATGMAILTRPNLVPMAMIVPGLLIWRLIAAGRSFRQVCEHVVLFALVAIPACLAIAYLNTVMWGSAVMSGHGSLDQLFSVANVWPNLVLYPRVVAMQMPLVVLVAVAWFARSKTDGHGWRLSTEANRPMMSALIACVVVVALAYLAYPAFDSSWNLRFLLPAIAPLLVIASVATVAMAGRLIDTHRAACVVILLIVGGYGVDYARDAGAFRTEHLHRFAAIGQYAGQLPERAVLLSMLHSGSATYYTGRPTLRYDLLAPDRLDGLVDELAQRGYVPYILLDVDELPIFRSRYRGHSRLAALDWPAVVTLKTKEVQIYANLYAIPAQR